MERRVLFAVFLSFLVLMAYQTFVVKPRTKALARATRTGAVADINAECGGAGEPRRAGPDNAGRTTATAPASSVVVGETTEREIVVDTATVRAVFSNRGAVLTSWRLKRYFDSKGAPIDILPAAIRQTEQKPFALTARRCGAYADGELRTLQTKRRWPGAWREVRHPPFEYRDVAGVHVTKTFELQAGGSPTS